jgi:hypothetical protein
MTLPEYITATRSTDLVNTVKHAALGLIPRFEPRRIPLR